MNRDSTLSEEKLIKITEANRANPYTDIIPYELGISFPIVNYTGFFPKSGECLIYAAPAKTFKDRTQVVGYSGKSGGASIHVAKGLTVRSGSSKGRAIKSQIRDCKDGDLIITNKRVVFVGKDDSFDFSIEKISALKLIDQESFLIQSGRMSKNILLDPALVVYASGFITYVQETNDDLFELSKYKLTNNEVEQCDAVRRDCDSIHITKKQRKQKKNGCLWFAARFLWIIVILVLVVLVVLIVKDNAKDKEKMNQISSYSDSELVQLKGHPKVFDLFSDAELFYSKIADKRIRLTDVGEKSREDIYSHDLVNKENVLYIIKSPSYEERIGEVEIDITSTKYAESLTVEKAGSLLVSYLPSDFFKYYESDSSYEYGTEDVKIYVCSFRMNQDGVNFRETEDGSYYPYYYSLIIHHVLKESAWKLETSFSAYGGKDLSWINNYSSAWNANGILQ